MVNEQKLDKRENDRVIDRRNICSVAKCLNKKAEGDLHFCPACRKIWIETCINNGIHEKSVAEDIVVELLRRFQKGG